MDTSPDTREGGEEAQAARSDGAGTVQLTVAGRVIQVDWDDLLDPRKWFQSSGNPSGR